MPKPKKVSSILTETHINHDQRHHTRNNFCASSGLQGITEVDTDPEGRFVSFKVTISNESSLFGPLQGIAPENSWLGGFFLKDYEIICKKKKEIEGNENKIMLGDLNYTMDEIDRDGENKTLRLCGCCFRYALSKLIVDNELEDLWRRENPDSPEPPATIGPLPRIHDRQGLY